MSLDGDFDGTAEFLETDGLGGYAMGTAGLIRTRRYHGLLVVAWPAPARRLMLVNGIEAWVEGAGARRILTRQFYAPGVSTPADPVPITGFSATPWPHWRFGVGPDTLGLELVMAEGSAEILLRFRPSAGMAGQLCVRPLLSGREHHGLQRENPDFRFEPVAQAGGNVAWRPYAGLPAIGALSNGAYEHAPEWYRRFLYAEEQARGLEAEEDLGSPGLFRFELGAGEAVLLFRAGDGLCERAAGRAAALAAGESARRGTLGTEGGAASSYLADRAPGRTVIAGFPWFTDWGRDSFIAVRGLCLARGRFAEARAVLGGWAGLVSEGMLPNRFPDGGGPAEFNSVDGSLWFVIAAAELLEADPAAASLGEALRGAMLAILRAYRDGTRFGIRMSEDGLLAAGVPGMQLTWMDARIGQTVVTPRIGKPVEVQALWHASLCLGARFAPEFGPLAARVRENFPARFLRPAGGLYDVVDCDHVAGRMDARVRPNQIFAVGGVPSPLLAGPAAARVVAEVEAELLTPIGLRSLSPRDPDYQKRYEGGPAERDGAYHQGTVWPFLIGPFVEAWLRVHGAAALAEARARFLPPFEAHLARAGLGHVSEIADGEAPHTPRGCPFQAWSMGEYLRVRAMLAAG